MKKWFQIAAIEPRTSERGVSTIAVAIKIRGFDQALPGAVLWRKNGITIHPVAKRENGDYKMQEPVATLNEQDFETLRTTGVLEFPGSCSFWLLPRSRKSKEER